MNKLSCTNEDGDTIKDEGYYMIELKALMYKNCTLNQAEGYADLLCDMLQDWDACPTSTIANVETITREHADELFDVSDHGEDDGEGHADEKGN